MDKKYYKLKEEDIKDLVPDMGYCFATDHISLEGMKIGFMYREDPEDKDDSGWRFFSGTEDQDYVDNPKNRMVFNINLIANLDPAIIPYLKMPFETELERVEGSDEFVILED